MRSVLVAFVVSFLFTSAVNAEHLTNTFVTIRAFCDTPEDVRRMFDENRSAEVDCFQSHGAVLGFVTERVGTLTLNDGRSVGIYRAILKIGGAGPVAVYLPAVEPEA